MEFKDKQFVEVKLEDKERDALSEADRVIDSLIKYLEDRNMDTIVYDYYGGEVSLDIDQLRTVGYNLEGLVNIKGVE